MIEIHTTATFDELFLKLPRKIQAKADEKTKKEMFTFLVNS